MYISEDKAKDILERLAKWHGAKLSIDTGIAQYGVHFEFNCGNMIIAWDKIHVDFKGRIFPEMDANCIRTCQEFLFAYVSNKLFLQTRNDDWCQEFADFRAICAESYAQLLITMDTMGI